LKQKVKVIQRSAGGRDLRIATGLEDFGWKTSLDCVTVYERNEKRKSKYQNGSDSQVFWNN
jgi:hypothetical protein